MSRFQKDIIISVDGYSSCGKSTFARLLAERLNYIYIDSGAMYRTVTLMCLDHNVITNGIIDLEKLACIIKNIDIGFIFNNRIGKAEVYLNGLNVEEEIRTTIIANNVSEVSKIPMVREKLVAIQRKLGNNKRIVMDGRDIGTVVFPGAEIKIFMTADIDVRAERRYKELIAVNENISLQAVKESLIRRDEIDVNRSESPLRMAKDAILLDSSKMSLEEELEWIIQIIDVKYQTNV